MVSTFELLKKYNGLISIFLPVQKIDLWILEKFLNPLYKPRKESYVMCIGGMFGEKDILQKYHKQNHKTEKIKIVACNILPAYLFHSLNYDFILSGKQGDASKDLMWDTAKQKLNTKEFDLVYIRFPDLFETNNWEQVLELSLQNITKQGVVFILVRKNDLKKLNRFLKNIKHKPVISKKTRITFLNEQSKIFHSVLVFKR